MHFIYKRFQKRIDISLDLFCNYKHWVKIFAECPVWCTIDYAHWLCSTSLIMFMQIYCEVWQWKNFEKKWCSYDKTSMIYIFWPTLCYRQHFIYRVGHVKQPLCINKRIFCSSRLQKPMKSGEKLFSISNCGGRSILVSLFSGMIDEVLVPVVPATLNLSFHAFREAFKNPGILWQW